MRFRNADRLPNNYAFEADFRLQPEKDETKILVPDRNSVVWLPSPVSSTDARALYRPPPMNVLPTTACHIIYTSTLISTHAISIPRPCPPHLSATLCDGYSQQEPQSCK